MGEDQPGRRTTLREFLGIAFVQVGTAISLFGLFLLAADAWLFDDLVRGWEFLGRGVGLTAALVGGWWILGKLLTAVWLSGRPGVRVIVAGMVVAACAGSTAAVGSRSLEIGQEMRFLEAGRFAFGPYPEEEELHTLRREGFVGVISVLGEETEELRSRVARERTAVGDAGLTFVQAPLLVDGRVDVESLHTLARVVERTDYAYYVHDLGAESRKLDLARRLILRLSDRPDVMDSPLTDGMRLERGPLTALGSDIFLSPVPTDPELLEYLVASPVRSVVMLLDPEDPADVPWIEKERAILETVDIGVKVEPVRELPYEPTRVRRLERLIRDEARPVVVHTFRTPSIVADAMELAFAFPDLPPLPAGLFRESLSGGEVRVVAPHVAVGPRPVGREFGWLYLRGIRRVALYRVGEARSYGLDRLTSASAGLGWYVFEAEDQLLDRLAQGGGPWYLYGPGTAELGARLGERFGPPFSSRDPGSAGEPSESSRSRSG